MLYYIEIFIYGVFCGMVSTLWPREFQKKKRQKSNEFWIHENFNTFQIHILWKGQLAMSSELFTARHTSVIT